jgi:hypothetical protein
MYRGFQCNGYFIDLRYRGQLLRGWAFDISQTKAILAQVDQFARAQGFTKFKRTQG